jgi:transposase
MVDLATFFTAVKPHLNEKTRRIIAAALTLGNEVGIKGQVSQATGVSYHAIRRGLKELQEGALKEAGFKGIRNDGGGRKKITHQYPDLVETLKSLVDSTTCGDPESPLMWTCKSIRVLAEELKKQDFNVSYPTVGKILEDLGYSLQGNKKVLEGSHHPDRNAQFQFLNRRVLAFLRMKQPIISVDCKKHELIGNFKNNGKEYHKKGVPTKVNDHDFMDKNLGKAIPFGIYDLSKNSGFVNLGIDHDTSIFAVQSIRAWWYKMGKPNYPTATRLLITADCGGSNGYRRRLWKYELSKFANETGLIISICHFPVGTSKWNKIEHRLFSQITMNWRGRPLTSLEVIVNLIAATKTTAGLKVDCNLDTSQCPVGLKVTDKELAQVKMKQHKFHGDWNYTLYP